MSSYLGRGLEQVDNISKLDNLTFNGGTTYALTKNSSAFTPISSNAILISIDGVIQQGNFSVSGTNIVFNFSPTGSNTCDFILHYGTGVAFTPADNSITKDKTNFISNSSSSGITSKGDGGSVDGSISLNCSQNSHHTKISSASHGAYSGNLNFVLPSSHGSNGQFLKTDGSGNLSFAEAGGANTPILWAKQSSAQSVATYTEVKLAFNTTLLNTGGTFDTSNYRWTPGTAGYYQFNIALFGRTVSDTGSTYVDLYLKRNGSNTNGGQARFRPSTDTSQTINYSGIVYSDSSDYFEVFIRYENGSTQSTDSNDDLTWWQMYKIIT